MFKPSVNILAKNTCSFMKLKTQLKEEINMMKINQLVVTGDNVMEFINKPNIYGVVPDVWDKDKYRLEPVGDCKMISVLTGEIPVIEVVKE